MVMKYHFQGLNATQVAESKKKHGANELPPVETESFMAKLWENFQDPLIHILTIALVVTLILAFLGYAEWYEGVGIAFAVFIATFVATYSEYKNEASFQILQQKASLVKNNVFRNGTNVLSILATEIVVGDYILLQAGDKIPAEGLLVAGEIEVNQSSLNGEPDHIKKVPPKSDKYAPQDQTNFLDPHLVFRGSTVESGEAVLKASAVGVQTIYGKLAVQMANSDDRESPLQAKLSTLADHISTFGYVGSSFIFVSFLFKQIVMDNHYNWTEIVAYCTNWQVALHDVVTSIILAIIVIVVAVPEGLPMMIAIVLSLNMRKLLKDKVLVRKLLGIETAGSVDILFVDKTGTLTKGVFEPKLFVLGNATKYDLDPRALNDMPEPVYSALGFALRESTSSAINSNGQIVGGNASDRALLSFLKPDTLSAKLDTDVEKDILFNSTLKFSARQISMPSQSAPAVAAAIGCPTTKGTVNITIVKGAPEAIFGNTTQFLNSKGAPEPMKNTQALLKEIDVLSNKGDRVIAVALSSKPLGKDIPKDLVLLGIVAVLDEPRPESKRAIKDAISAGIQVVMITGDKKETAVAIAKEVGLLEASAEKTGVYTSQDLQKFSDAELAKRLPSIRVIARALPTDKSRFVEVSKSQSRVVGMTGDGVNDSAALKLSDVGFAMGSGSEVSKEAADIVILDDNFASITQAVLYGRTIYKSIQKFIVFQLTINVASLLIVFLGPFLGIDFPLTLIQLLWVNLVMDTLAALAFGGEPALHRYMKERPIKRTAAIITRRMWFTLLTGGAFIAALSIVFLVNDSIPQLFIRNGQPNEPAFLTAFFAFFIFLAVVNAFNVRTNRLNLFDHLLNNSGFILVVLFIFAVQISFSLIGGKVLRTVGLTVPEWTNIILAALVILPYGLLCKLVFNTVFRKQKND